MIVHKDKLLILARDLIAQDVRLIPVGHDKRPAWSLLPIDPDTGKRSWDLLVKEPTRSAMVAAWLNVELVGGLAAVCGSRSDGLYVFDVDEPRFFNKWLADGPTVFWEAGAAYQETGGGGYQIAVKVSGDMPGNLKLAWVPDTSENSGRSIAIETRGEGGYIVLPYSIHPDGAYYQDKPIFGGSWGNIPTITSQQLEVLHETAKMTCEAPKTRQQKKREAKADAARAKNNMSKPKRIYEQGESVIDRFNAEISITDMLGQHGYTQITPDRWARPGSKSNNPSVHVYDSDNRSIHYSTNDPLSDGKGKTSFNVFCYYKHNDNIKEAVKDAVRMLNVPMANGQHQQQAQTWENIPESHNHAPPAWINDAPDWDHQMPINEEQQDRPLQLALAVNQPMARKSVDLLGYLINDAGNSDTFRALYGHIFRHVDQWGWLVYTGTHWKRQGAEKQVANKIRDTLERRCKAALKLEDEDKIKKYLSRCAPTAKNIRNCLYLVKNDIHLDAQPDHFDKHPFLLAVANGILDLRTGKLMPHDPALMMTSCLTTAYNPQADQTLITGFLAGLGLSHDVIIYLQDGSGYTLTGSTREECLFYIFGPTRSGKGTFVSALRALMGSPLSSEIKFDTLTGGKHDADAQNFALAPLKPCRLIVASESGKYSSLNEAKVKQITGGDSIYCAFKGKNHFNYRPSFKIWLTSNHAPKADVNDDAIWRSRLKLIEFPNSFLGQEDKGLKDALMNDPAYKEALLAWAVSGAYRWFNSKRGLVAPAEVIEATKAARDQLDYVQQWLDECCIDDQKAKVTNAVLYASYESWCDENGVSAKKKRAFGRDMSQKNYEPKRWKQDGKTVRGFKGVFVTE